MPRFNLGHFFIYRGGEEEIEFTKSFEFLHQ